IHAMNGNIVLLRGDGHSIGLRRGEGSVDSSDARRAASARAESFSYNSPGEDHFDFEFAFDEERWSRFAAQVALQAADIASAAADVGLDAALASLEALRLDE